MVDVCLDQQWALKRVLEMDTTNYEQRPVDLGTPLKSVVRVLGFHGSLGELLTDVTFSSTVEVFA
jgi:hypothetical protein